MAQLKSVTVTVNGQSVAQYTSKEKSREIEKFIADEMRFFGRVCRPHIRSHSTRSHNYVRQAPLAGDSVKREVSK